MKFPTLAKPKIRKRTIKKVAVTALYAFVAVITILSMVMPSMQY
jgi:hypothetical protein